MEQLDVVKRENKNLADEIKDLLDHWEMEDVPFTSSTNNAVALKSKRKSSKPLLRRLKQHLNRKKTRSSELSLSLDKFDKKLIERSMRRKKSLTTHAKITNAPWTQCR